MILLDRISNLVFLVKMSLSRVDWYDSYSLFPNDFMWGEKMKK